MPNWFKNSGMQREHIVYTQKKRILAIYRGMYFEVRNLVRNSAVQIGLAVPNTIKKMYYDSMGRHINDIVGVSLSHVEPMVKENMEAVSLAVMEDNLEMLYDMGFGYAELTDLEKQREEESKRIVSLIVKGGLYDKRWTLFGFVADEQKKIMSDVRKIISKCMDMGLPEDEILRNVELYFSPDQEKRKGFFAMFPGIKHKIAYDTTRVGNTMVGHAYEETFVNVTIENPFIEAYRWVTSGSDKVCPVCIDRESTDKFGLGAGIFPKDRLPLDHPNGMCTFDPVYVMGTGEIIREIDLWKKGGQGTMGEKINRWVKSFSKK